jgi:hypothetical protein
MPRPLRQAQDRLAQDLVRPAKLLHLAFQRLDPIPVAGGLRRWSRSSARLLVVQPTLAAIELIAAHSEG